MSRSFQSQWLPSILKGAAAALTMLGGVCMAADGAGWMTAMDGETPLSRISIPGTHDAGALHEPVPGTTRCQSLGIAEQLQAGVRFLDIRCRHVKDSFAIYHGMVDQKLSFDRVLEICQAFLKDHPGETIVMSAKEEYKPEDNTRSFEATFQAYLDRNPQLWRLSPDLPKLSEARGKIVLFRRFPAKAIGGIDASVWPDSTTFSSGKLRVQDAYQVKTNDAKWQAVADLLAESAKGSAGTLHVNFTSGFRSGKLGIPSIPAVSDDLNKRFLAYLDAHPRECTGIMVMDFVTAEQCAAVYRRNLPESK